VVSGTVRTRDVVRKLPAAGADGADATAGPARPRAAARD